MRFSLILIIAGIVLMSGCSGGSVQSMFVSTPPRIDGDLSEWQKIPVALFDDRKIAMGAMNDGQYLYVAGRCVEEELTRSIKRSGLTVWIDPEGKKSKDLELRYPASRDAQPDQTRGGFWQIMSDDQKKKASEKLDQMKKGVLLIDKHVIDSRVFVPDTAGGFASAIAESNGILFFEIRIPLHIEQFFPELPPLSDRHTIDVGFGPGGFLRRGQNRGESGGMPYGQQGGMMGGGRRRGSSRGSQMYDNSDVWVEVALARPS